MFLHSFLKIQIFLPIHWIKHWSYSGLGAEPLLLTLPVGTKNSHLQAIRDKDPNFLTTQGSMPSTWTELLSSSRMPVFSGSAYCSPQLNLILNDATI